MISEIEIEGFKSLETVRLKLGGLNLFIGTNASGKSNFFDALRVRPRRAFSGSAWASAQRMGERGENFAALVKTIIADEDLRSAYLSVLASPTDSHRAG